MAGFTQIDEISTWWASRAPHRTVLREGGTLLSWADLEQAIDGTAAALARAGLRPGERLAIVGENCIAMVVLLFAAARLGLWSVPLNARLSATELSALATHCGARAIAYTVAASPAAAAHAHAAGAAPWQPDGVAGLALAFPPANGGQAAEPPAPEPGERIATLIYTSGTTAQPKAVMLRQRNLTAVAALSAAARCLHDGDLAYGVLPLAHVFGYSSVLLATLHAGAAVWLEPRFDPARAWAALSAGVTVLQGVPTLYSRLLEHSPAALPAGTPGRLRALFSGGAPLDPQLKRAVEQRFGLPLHNGYGLTENGPSVCQTLIEAPRGDDAVGPPLPGVELAIVGPDGLPVAEGQAGRLRVRGPGVMAGYYRDPEASAGILAGGWLDTGDVVRQAPDGALFVLGRHKEMIIRSGFKIHPLEVEAAIQAWPGVRHAAVLGHGIAAGDQEVVAFVEWESRAGSDWGALAAHLRGVLAPYKQPARWIAVDRMPLTLSGKVRKADLAARLQASAPIVP